MPEGSRDQQIKGIKGYQELFLRFSGQEQPLTYEKLSKAIAVFNGN